MIAAGDQVNGRRDWESSVLSHEISVHCIRSLNLTEDQSLSRPCLSPLETSLDHYGPSLSFIMHRIRGVRGHSSIYS